MEIAQGRARLHDGETRHFLRARNQILLEQSFDGGGIARGQKR